MSKELQNRMIADLVLSASLEDVGEQPLEQLKRYLLNALGSMFYASNKPPIKKLIA